MWMWLAVRWIVSAGSDYGMNGSGDGRFSLPARENSFRMCQSHREGNDSQLGKQKTMPTSKTVNQGACSDPNTSP